MGETLFNQFADERALVEQREFFLREILAPIKEGILRLNVNVGTIDSSQSKRNVDELSRAVDALTNNTTAVKDKIAELNSVLKDFATLSGASAKSHKDAAAAALLEAKAETENAKAKKESAKASENNSKAAQADLKLREQISKESEKSAAAIKKSNDELKKSVAGPTSTAAGEKETTKAKQEGATADKEAAKASAERARAAAASAQSLKAEQKAAEEAANDFLQLGKAYKDAATKASNFALALGLNHPVTLQAQKDALDMSNLLKKLEAAVGNNQRNVGNYAGAIRGLGFSFTQVARELPSLAVNFQQFALAISNNLPFVADSLVQTRKELANLRAEGKQAPSLFSAITKSILTWQVGLAVGITLFTVFAKEIGKFFSDLFDTSTAFSRAQAELAATMNKVNIESESQTAQLMALYEITQDTTQQLDDRVDATNEIIKQSKELNKATGENIQLTKDENGVLKLNEQEWLKLLVVLIRVEKTKAVLSSIGEAFKKVITAQTASLSSQTTVAGDILRNIAAGGNLFNPLAGAEQTAKRAVENKAAATADAEAYLSALEKRLLSGLKTGEFDLSGVFDKKGAEDAVKAIDVLLTGQLETLSRRQHEIADNEDNFIAERQAARVLAFKTDEELLNKRTNFEISEARKNAAAQIEEADGNAADIKTIQSNLGKDIAKILDQAGVEHREILDKNREQKLALEKGFYDKLIAQTVAGEKNLADARKGTISDRTEDAKRSFEEDQALTGAFYDQQNKIIESGLKKGKTKLDDYNRAKELSQLAFQKAQIDDEIAFQVKLLAVERSKPDGDEAAIQNKINALKAKSRELDLKDLEKYLSKVVDFEKKAAEEIKKAKEELTDKARENGFAILEGLYDRQINKIRDQIDVVNELKAAEIERVNSSTANAEEKAARIKIIEARAQNDREALERRQRAVEKKKAIIQKAASAFEITIGAIKDVARIKGEFAVAIAAAAKLPIPLNGIHTAFLIAQQASLIGLTVAATAANLAGVAATPIPHFAAGTESSPEGIAEVAERGPELAVDRRGKAKVYEKRTLAYLTKGTKIYPADATKAILNAAEQDRTTLLKSFNSNVTISAPDYNSTELKKQTKILESLESKSMIIIMNNAPIETEAWYQQHFKF